MAPRDRLHILVPTPATAEDYLPAVSGRAGASPPSPADRVAHGQRLRTELDTAFSQGKTRRDQSAVSVQGAVDGIYVRFQSLPEFELALTSLEPQHGRAHPELRAVTEELVNDERVRFATVFVPDGWIGRFLSRFEQYSCEDTPRGGPSTAPLSRASPPSGLPRFGRCGRTSRRTSRPPGLQCGGRCGSAVAKAPNDASAPTPQRPTSRSAPGELMFEDRLVLLARGDAGAARSPLDVLDDLAELRRRPRRLSSSPACRRPKRRTSSEN